MKTCLILIGLLALPWVARGGERPASSGWASWYGEAHRGKLMANGKRFDPDKPTAASWFYPLGTRVRVSLKPDFPRERPRSVIVTITDRGPAHNLVREGRIIDLSHSVFKQLAHPDLGLVRVVVRPASLSGS